VSAEVVNLRRARKAARRDQAQAQAAENRTAFGLSGAERERRRAEKQRAAKDLDHHRLTPTKS
jgi:Domain of unknown function (DUF4169)